MDILLFYPDNKAQEHSLLPLILNDQQDFGDMKVNQIPTTVNHFFALSWVRTACDLLSDYLI